jgi:salicylate hydroxylase
MTSPTPQNEKPFNIAILGGGIGGLCLAIGLHKRHIPFHLYEAAHAFAEVGAGVAFGPNSLRAMGLVDPVLLERYMEHVTYNAFPSKRHTWLDYYAGMDSGLGKAEEHFHELTTGEGVLGMCCIHRAVFLDQLISLVPSEMVSFKKRAIGVEETSNGVRIKFEDGSEASASATVGCDGVKSNVRKWVLGKDDPASYPSFTGKYAYRGILPMDKAANLLGDQAARNSTMWIGKQGHILTVPIEKGELLNVVAFKTKKDGKWDDKSWVLPQDRKHIEDDYADWGDSVKKIVSLMEKPDVWAMFNYPPAHTYYKGRTCLSGDAAHASTPHHGAGAGMAIEDAYIMASLLAEVEDEKSIEEAFRAFDFVRRPRTQRLVNSSRESGKVLACEGEGVGEDKEKWIAKITESHRWIWEKNLEEDLEVAMGMLKGSKA